MLVWSRCSPKNICITIWFGEHNASLNHGDISTRLIPSLRDVLLTIHDSQHQTPELIIFFIFSQDVALHYLSSSPVPCTNGSRHQHDLLESSVRCRLCLWSLLRGVSDGPIQDVGLFLPNRLGFSDVNIVNHPGYSASTRNPTLRPR